MRMYCSILTVRYCVFKAFTKESISFDFDWMKDANGVKKRKNDVTKLDFRSQDYNSLPPLSLTCTNLFLPHLNSQET